ncbi:MAG: chemotaxis protein CheW [Pseudomonadota bacterium]
MDKNINLSIDSVKSIARNESTRGRWLDKHAELIAKLEAEYQQPIDTEKESSVLHFHEFSVGSLNILISEQHSPEILEDNVVYPMLLTPNWVIGTCNVRGEIIPVFDLEKIIFPDITVARPENYKTLILRDGKYTIGLPLFSLPKLIQFDKSDITDDSSKLPEIVRPFIKEIYRRKQNICVLLDLAAFLAFLKAKYIHT